MSYYHDTTPCERKLGRGIGTASAVRPCSHDRVCHRSRYSHSPEGSWPRQSLLPLRTPQRSLASCRHLSQHRRTTPPLLRATRQSHTPRRRTAARRSTSRVSGRMCRRSGTRACTAQRRRRAAGMALCRCRDQCWRRRSRGRCMPQGTQRTGSHRRNSHLSRRMCLQLPLHCRLSCTL